MTNKRTLKGNLSISENVSEVSNLAVGQRALVVKEVLSGLEAVPAKDYYNLVILETDLATVSVAKPDFIIFSDITPYRNSFMHLESLDTFQDAIFCLNYLAAEQYLKLNRILNIHTLTYLGSSEPITATPTVVKNISCGLNEEAPGVHLAKLMGCSTIHYTGESAFALSVGLNEITNFVVEKDRFNPRNLIGVDRQNFLATQF